MKTVMITGASRGIGAACALRFAREGMNLILICSKDTERLENVARECGNRYGVRCETYTCDVSDPQALEALFATCSEPDILINNAGISYFGLLSDMTPEDWNRVIGTNLSSCFYTARKVIPAMVRKQSGVIINVSSVWGNCGSSLEVAYSASKGGINAFTKALAKELAPSHIRVNAVAPGVIDTEMNACLPEEDLDALRQEIPADRLGTADEVAELIFGVASAPEYLTGQVITIDGGWQ